MGKSTFGLRYLCNADLSVRFLFDPDPAEGGPPDLGEFAFRLGLPPARDLFELSVATCQGWVCYDPHTHYAGRLEEAFTMFCRWAYEKSLSIPGKKILMVDEIWRYVSPQAIPQELSEIVQSGRKRGLYLMANIQEPNKLNGAIANGASEVVCFKLQGLRSLEFVEKTYGFDPEEVSSLQPLHFVARNLDSQGELRGRIKL